MFHFFYCINLAFSFSDDFTHHLDVDVSLRFAILLQIMQFQFTIVSFGKA